MDSPKTVKSAPATLWPEDNEHACDVATAGPNTDLAVILLAAGCTQSYIRHQCGFETARDVQAFCREPETKQAVAEAQTARAQRVGKRALVSLERIVSEPHTDLRAQVLAIRTALEVSGDLKRDHAAPVKHVRELSVPELTQLIETTRAELDARITMHRAGRSATQ